MERSVSKLFHKSSFSAVLSPFIRFYNLLGISIFKLTDGRKFDVSRIAVVSLLVYFPLGCYFIYKSLWSDYSLPGFFKYIGIGMYINSVTFSSFAFIMMLVNLATGKFFKNLLKAFIKFDEISGLILVINHSRQFVVLTIFWISTKVFLLYIPIRVALARLSEVPKNTYILIGTVYACELPFIMLFLATARLRSLRQALSATKFSKALFRDEFNKFAKALDQIFVIINLICKSFSIQMTLFFLLLLSIGMFTIFVGFEIAVYGESPVTSVLFEISIRFTVYFHSMILLVCLFTGSMSHDVSSNQMLTSLL